MFNPRQTLDKAIAGVNDYLTSPKKKAELTYTRPPAPKQTPTYRFRTPTTRDVELGRSNATDASKAPKGTVFGSNELGQPTPQSRALKAKSK